MLASARPVPSATAGYFRIHHVRFRTSGVVGGALGGTSGGERVGEVFLVCSQLDSKMVVSGSQIPSELETQGTADRLLQPSHRSYFCTLVTIDPAPSPVHPTRLTDPDCP